MSDLEFWKSVTENTNDSLEGKLILKKPASTNTLSFKLDGGQQEVDKGMAVIPPTSSLLSDPSGLTGNVKIDPNADMLQDRGEVSSPQRNWMWPWESLGLGAADFVHSRLLGEAVRGTTDIADPAKAVEEGRPLAPEVLSRIKPTAEDIKQSDFEDLMPEVGSSDMLQRLSDDMLMEAFAKRKANVATAESVGKWVEDFLTSPEWRQHKQEMTGTEKPEDGLGKANWYAGRILDSTLSNLPLMADSMVESSLAGILGTMVAGPAGGKVAAYSAGWNAMAMSEAGNWYQEVQAPLRQFAADGVDEKKIAKIDALAAESAVEYGTIAGLIEHASTVYEAGRLKSIFTGKKPTEAVQQALKDPAFKRYVKAMLPTGLSEAVEEMSQTGLSNVIKQRFAARVMKETGISVKMQNESVVDAGIMALGSGMLLGAGAQVGKDTVDAVKPTISRQRAASAEAAMPGVAAELFSSPGLSTGDKAMISTTLDNYMTEIRKTVQMSDDDATVMRTMLWRFAVIAAKRQNSTVDSVLADVRVQAGKSVRGKNVLAQSQLPHLPDSYYEREAKDRAGLHLALPAFIMSPKFGLPTNKPLDGKQLLGRLASLQLTSELEYYKSVGLEQFLSTPRTALDVAEWMQQMGPKVQVSEYGMKQKVTPTRQAYDELTHSWVEGLTDYKTNQLVTFVERTSEVEGISYLQSLGWTSEDIEKAKRFKELEEKLGQEAVENYDKPLATSFYTTISPKDVKTHPVQRVDVVLPQKERAATDTIGADLQGWEKGRRDKEGLELETPLWRSDNLHENLPNTLGWAAIQYETLPNGEKVAHVYELQSRWAQTYRDAEQSLKAWVRQIGGKFYLVHPENSTFEPSDRDMSFESAEKALEEMKLRQDGKYAEIFKAPPLLKDWQTLVLKAVIQQARANGATSIALSDAETAMMTEKHDSNVVYTILPSEHNKQVAQKTGTHKAVLSDKQVNLFDEYLAKASVEEERKAGFELTPIILQEGGMRLNYDKIAPKILQELTGESGRVENFGEHKNALNPNAFEERHNSNYSYYRNDLIFKNPYGTPKTSVTARTYSLTSARPYFGMFTKDKAGGERLFQDELSLEAPAKGSIQFLKDGTALINLFKTADFSTVIHEFVHNFSRYWSTEDVGVIAAWGKVDAKLLQKFVDKAEDLTKSEMDTLRPVLESFAREFELWCRAGKAPVKGLRSLFTRLRQILTNIYQSVKDARQQMGHPFRMTDEIRRVFEDMVVDEEERQQEYGEIRNAGAQRWQIYLHPRLGRAVYVKRPGSFSYDIIAVSNLRSGAAATPEQTRLLGQGAKWVSPSEIFPEAILTNDLVRYDYLQQILDRMSYEEMKDFARSFPNLTIPATLDTKERLHRWLSAVLSQEFESSLSDRPFYGHEREGLLQAIKQAAANGDVKAAAKMLVKGNLVTQGGKASLVDFFRRTSQFNQDLAYVLEKRAPKMGRILRSLSITHNHRANLIHGTCRPDLEKLMKSLRASHWQDRKKAQIALDWLHERNWDPTHSFFDTNFKRIQNGEIDLQNLPAHVDAEVVHQIVATYGRLFSATGEVMETGTMLGVKIGLGGVYTWKKADKKVKGSKAGYVPFTRIQPGSDATTMQRSYTDYFYDIMGMAADKTMEVEKSDGTKETKYYNGIRKIIADAIAVANPGMDASKMLWKLEQMAKDFSATSGNQKLAAMERLRTLARMPDGVRVRMQGRWVTIDLLETDIGTSAMKMVENTANRYSFISTFAPFDSTSGRYNNQLRADEVQDGHFAKVLKEQREAYRREDSSNAGIELYDGFIRALNGLPVIPHDGSLLFGTWKNANAPGTWSYELGRYSRAALNMVKGLMLSGPSYATWNLVEPLGLMASSFGVKNVLRHYVRSFSPSALVSPESRQMLSMVTQLGARGLQTYKWRVDPNQTMGGRAMERMNIFANFARYPGMYTARKAEVLAGLAARDMVEDLKKGKVLGIYRDTLRGMGYTDSQVREMIANTPGSGSSREQLDSLYESVVQNAAVFALGTNARNSQLPWVAHSRQFNTYLSFYRYFQNIYARTSDRVTRAVAGKTKEERVDAMRAIARQLAGTAVTVEVGNLILAAVKSFCGGDDREFRVIFQQHKSPSQFFSWMGWQMAGQLVWAPLVETLKSDFQFDNVSTEEMLARRLVGLSMPVGFVAELADAMAGKAHYLGMPMLKRGVEFLDRNASGYKHLHMMYKAYFLGYDNSVDIAVREFYKVARKEDVSYNVTFSQGAEKDYFEWRYAIKDAAKYIAAGSPELISQKTLDTLMKPSATKMGNIRDVSEAFHSRAITTKLTPDELKRISEKMDPVLWNDILQHDRLLLSQ